MEPAARLLVNVKGTKSYILWNGTESYFEKLRAAYKDIQDNRQGDYLHFAFFTLCASTLEYSLNFILTDYCVNKHGPDKYKSFAEGYIAISFAKKLLMTPCIVTEGQLTFNEDHKSYKNLLELISLRNKILHNKNFLEEFDFPDLKTADENIEFQIKIEPNHIDRLKKENCLTFGRSLGDFKKYLMTPALNHELTENEMIIKIK
ncbi:MAG: hypothetical protein ACOYXT_22830 [Bacteroidota bacterium]